jgi:hypothetical protein
MRLILYFTILFLFACGNKNYNPAEDALDAAREFKDACLKGDFAKANFYLLSSKENEIQLNKLKEIYFNQASNEIKESREASIIIQSSKEITANKTQIILRNSYSKILDTIIVVQQNKVWQVDLK